MLLVGNAMAIPLRDESVQCVVTSPPYWRLRDYDLGAGGIGLEKTLEEYVAKLVLVFREVRRILRADGTLWLNLGDSSRAKNLCMIPARVALALQADGWRLRSDIVWSKANPMPESVKDRPTRSHEYVFLFSKSPRYFYDQEAVKVPASPNTHARYARGKSTPQKWADGDPGDQTLARVTAHMRKPGVNPKAVKIPSGWSGDNGNHHTLAGRYKAPGRNSRIYRDRDPEHSPAIKPKQNESFSTAVKDIVDLRNLRTVWTFPTQGYSGAHFATFPERLVEPCILAGSRPGDLVFDPCCGTGTVGVVAARHRRRFLGMDLQGKYIRDLAMERNRNIDILLF